MFGKNERTKQTSTLWNTLCYFVETLYSKYAFIMNQEIVPIMIS